MTKVYSRKVNGVERDRSILRGAALRIIGSILEKPLRDRKGSRRDGLAPIPLSSFTRLEPVGWGINEDDWWIFCPEDCTPDIVWPIDTGFVAERSDCGDDNILSLGKFRTITFKEARGFVNKFSPFMVRSDHGQAYEGQLGTCAGIMAWLGGKWVYADQSNQWVGGDKWLMESGGILDDRLAEQPRLATAIALRQRYEWAVSLGLEHSPSVRFATDPTGVKEIFKIRDLPEGRDRRDALLGWVGDHWRQDRYDPDMEIYVRKHMRGRTEFTWRNMKCELLPSQFDIEQRDKFISMRDDMKNTGNHKRRREAVV